MYSKIEWFRRLCTLLSVAIVIMASVSGYATDGQTTAQASPKADSSESLQDILHYISMGWDSLTRSLGDCATFVDRKTKGEPVLYFPAEIARPADVVGLESRCSVRVEPLPEIITASNENALPEISPHGLLYLEHPYVVPGGQFNEMYGWDSYFIVRGLLRSGRKDLARGMVENFFYEIQHYGGVLNANRTYYLGRSQPPFLSSMILAVYHADVAGEHSNLRWLDTAYHFAVSDYEQWTRAPHLAGDTGLSRYFDEGEGPVPEIMGDPSDYYRGVVHYFLIHEGEDSPRLVRVGAQHALASIRGPVFQIAVCDPAPTEIGNAGCAQADRLGLTSDFYKGDRSMRESGFDVSFRFGPYGADAQHYAPVCLNSLLYKTETDLEEMSRLLGRTDDALRWREKARQRQEKIVKYFWDSGRGLFFDYNFETHQRSSYEYATTLYPLWVGVASEEQARAVAANLPLFEQPGGLAMSRFESQAQWDYPYGWAPIHLLAVEGLRRYGYRADADRITQKFLAMVLQNFRRDHTIREKYDVVTRSAATSITAGYAQNVIGFGWTNAVFVELLYELPPELRAGIGDG